jgi:hypothetical protein
MMPVKQPGNRVKGLALLPAIPHLRHLGVRVVDPFSISHCTHSIFLEKDKVLRSPIDPASPNRMFSSHYY